MSDRLGVRAALVGWAGSLALHGALVLLASVALVVPDTGFELQAPEEIELGLVEATEVEAAAPAGAPPEPEEPEEPPPAVAEGALAEGAEAAPRPPPRPRRPRRDPPPANENEPGGAGSSPVAFLPAGAQLALRIDMDRVRGSPVGEDIASLLRVVPDWQALLGGSGVDPVRDLSRVLIATPNLQRASLVIAGRLSQGAPEPRDVARQLAEAQGLDVDWREQAGVLATRWPSPDGIARDVALVGERHFVIARPEDLPRVLAIASARRGRSAPIDARPADALLSMDEGEGLSVEVENVAVFVRRSPCVVPQRLRAGIVERTDGVLLRGEARFETAAAAEEARGCLAARAEQAASNVIVALYGLSGPLDRLRFTVEGEVLRIESEMRHAEIRTVVGLVRGLFASPPPAPAPSPPPPSLPPPSPPPLPGSPPPPPPSPY